MRDVTTPIAIRARGLAVHHDEVTNAEPFEADTALPMHVLTGTSVFLSQKSRLGGDATVARRRVGRFNAVWVPALRVLLLARARDRTIFLMTSKGTSSKCHSRWGSLVVGLVFVLRQTAGCLRYG